MSKITNTVEMCEEEVGRGGKRGKTERRMEERMKTE